jgi:toxin FitB
MRLLLDTCVLSELQKPARSAAAVAFIDGQPDSLLHISVITIGEIAKGVALLPDGSKKQSLETWRTTLAGQFEDRILPVDQKTGGAMGRVDVNRAAKGKDDSGSRRVDRRHRLAAWTARGDT